MSTLSILYVALTVLILFMDIGNHGARLIISYHAVRGMFTPPYEVAFTNTYTNTISVHCVFQTHQSLGSQSCEPASWTEKLSPIQDQRPKPTLKTVLHTLTQSPTLTKYSNSPVQPYQSSPPSLSPATHRLTHPHLSNPICPLCKTHPHTTEHRFNCTLIYLKQHTGPLDVS